MSETKWGAETELWHAIPAPYRPTETDLALIRQACPPGLLDETSSPRILILGVTPPLVAAPWPAGSELHAVDYDQATIDTVWQPGERRQSHCAHWQDMPFPDDYFDLVIGDGSFNALPGLEHYDDVLREISRVRRPGAPLCCRFFMQSEPRLTLEYLMHEASGKFAGYRPFARQALIPIAASETDGRLHSLDTPARIVEQCGDVDQFLDALAQGPKEKQLILRVFEFDQYLNFPNRSQVLEKFGEYFSDVDIVEPDYDCGEFCPMVCCS